MPIDKVLAGVAVADFEASLAWYERLLEGPADVLPMPGLAEWHVSDAAVIQVVLDAKRAGGSLLCLSVDDLNQQLAGLEDRGLTPETTDETTSEKVLFATITDPDRNAITLVEQRSADA